jgi:uncharacterized protein involved in exopolysaccharide biosynthesis
MEPSLFGSLLKIAICCIKHKKLFVAFFFLPCVIAAFIIWVIISPTYKATSVFTVIQKDNNSIFGMSSMMSEFSKLPSLGGMNLGSLLSKDNSEDLLVAYSKSWEFYDNIIEKFGLEEHYEQKSKYKADLYKIFGKNIDLDWNKDDMLELSVKDKDFKLARSINDHIVYLLDSTYANMKSYLSDKKLKFYEQQIDSAKKDMFAIEEKIIKFQNDNRFYDFGSQLSATMDFLSSRALVKTALDEELAYRGQTSYSEKLKLHLGSIDNQIINSNKNKKNSLPLLELDKAPELVLQYAQMDLELKSQTIRYLNLLQTHESVKLEKADRTDALFIISSAWDNPKKDSPPRTALMIVFIGLFGVVSIFACVFTEWSKGETENSRLWRNMLAEFRRK